MSRHVSFTEKRRARLRKAVDRIERLEPRTTITEPISVTALSVGTLGGLAQLGLVQVHGGSDALDRLAAASRAAQKRGVKTAAMQNPAPSQTSTYLPIVVAPRTNQGSAGWSKGSSPATPAPAPGADGASQSGDWLNLSTAASDSTEPGILGPWKPAKPPGGGAAMAPRGGSGALAAPAHGAITPLRVPAPASGPSGGAGGMAALLAAAGSAGGSAAASPAGPAAATAQAASRAAPRASMPAAAPSGSPLDAVLPSAGSGGSALPGSTPDPTHGNSSGPSELSFPYYPAYVLDNNDGVALFPGVTQYALPGTYADLKAQVSGTTVSSYNWNTSGLSGATSISGGSTYQLTWKWPTDVPTAENESVTLSVTDVNSHTETYTYDFYLASGDNSGGGSGGSGGGTNATWPSSLAPDQELLSAHSFDSDGVSVDATSGALDATIPLPSYNPNVPALALTYDSLTANPMPIIIVENPLPATGSVPSQVSAQLTFNSSAGTTWYYSTSQFNPGDIQQIALQATGATSLSTGRYSYSATVVDIGSTNTTTTYSGSATLLSETGSAFGDGWTLQGLEEITSASGGVILNLGDGGRASGLPATSARAAAPTPIHRASSAR